jgi:ketosteroid isomerase-like protein
MMTANKSEDLRVRRLIEQWALAVRARDIEAVVADHVEDMAMFDVPPPVELRGIDAYRDSWPGFFKWLENESGAFEIVRLDVTAGETVAFATALLRCGTKASLTQDDTARLRLTIGLRKIDGAWKIAHEHHSFPAEQ